jgi:uncharacterized protein (DUF1800 family)
MAQDKAVSALNRFGLGARPGERQRIGEPRDWLLAQLRSEPISAAFQGLPDSRDYLRREFAYNRERIAGRRAQRANPGSATSSARTDAAMKSGDDGKEAVGKFKNGFRKAFGQDQLAELAARYRSATTNETGFRERLVHFWSNHFAISVDKRPAALYAAPMEREAIRPHVAGRFADMLLAAETHPGMLRYLDNVQSVGEGSMFATRGTRRQRRRQGDDMPQRKRGLNENLAREILELHTLGVDGGYTQADVSEVARAITGWGTPLARDGREDAANVQSAFVFRPGAHEPGARSVLGKRYAEGGVGQGRAILADLAQHPATARHLSLKLARHFIADVPPQALVERMAAAYLKSDGDLAVVYRTMIESDLAWDADARKFKQPDDFIVSALRAGGIDAGAAPRQTVGLLRRLGQPPFTPRSPAGFADTADDWTGPDALWKRVQVAQALAQRVPGQQLDPLRVAQDVFGNSLDAETSTALQRAESERDGLALLFASPAFQWRT